MILLVAAGAWIGLENLNGARLAERAREAAREQAEDQLAEQFKALERLAREAATLLENRRWPEAAAALEAIEALEPASPVVAAGRERIAAGIEEERRQFVGYWLGQAEAALESGDWQAVEAAVAKVRDQAPAEPELDGILARLADGRKVAAVMGAIAEGQRALDARQWETARKAVARVLAEQPDHPQAAAVLAAADAGAARELADRARAAELFARAQLLDSGAYNHEALELLREATQLDPGNLAAARLFEKMASYVRTIRVPEDFATIGAALAQAKPRDRLVIGEGTWQESLVVPVGMEIQGAGPERTIIECEAASGSVITLGPESSGSAVFGITFRHVMFDPALERFAVALVNGGKVSFGECRFEQGSGHGLAIIANGSAEVRRCWARGNGWDGMAAYGPGAALHLADSVAEENFGHGVDVWDGASAIIEGSRIRANSRNGVLLQSLGKLSVRRNVCSDNREFGIVAGLGKEGDIEGNVVERNLLGGMVVRTAAGGLRIEANRSHSNLGPGMVFERGLVVAGSNESRGNQGGEILADAVMPEPVEVAEVIDDPARMPDPAAEEVPRRAVIVEEP
jgi:hypothetical protein